MCVLIGIRMQIILLTSIVSIVVVNSNNKSVTLPKTGNHLRRNSPFETCAGTNRITLTQMGRMTKMATALLSECAFKIISSTHYVWSPDVADCIPLMLHKICYAFRIGYELYSDRPGHLPNEYSRNGTLIYNILNKMLNSYADESIYGPTLCCENPTLKRTSCFPKKPVSDLLQLFLDCGRQSMKNALPEYYEEITAGSVFGTRKLLSSGVLKFMLG